MVYYILSSSDVTFCFTVLLKIEEGKISSRVSISNQLLKTIQLNVSSLFHKYNTIVIYLIKAFNFANNVSEYNLFIGMHKAGKEMCSIIRIQLVLYTIDTRFVLGEYY